jgi:cytochrome c5
MKSKLFAAALVVLLFSCSPKVAVTAQKPDPVQVPPKIASPNEATVSTEKYPEGKILYEGRCAQCHKLFAPTAYSKENWAPILVRMQKKAHIEDADMAQINNYIYSHL